MVRNKVYAVGVELDIVAASVGMTTVMDVTVRSVLMEQGTCAQVSIYRLLRVAGVHAAGRTHPRASSSRRHSTVLSLHGAP